MQNAEQIDTSDDGNAISTELTVVQLPAQSKEKGFQICCECDLFGVTYETQKISIH